MMLPQESIGEGLKKFFVNTLDWNGMGRRPDVRIQVPIFGTAKPEVSDLSGDYDSYFGNLVYSQRYHNQNLSIQSNPPTLPSEVFAGLQLNQNFVVPRPFCYPISAQPSSSALGGEEIMQFRGTGTYIPPVSVEEKLMSQGMGTYIPNMESWGAGTFIPDIGVQEKLIPQGTVRCILGMDDKVKESKGTVIFIPDKGVDENYKSGAVTNILHMGLEEDYRPGGTETQIPDMHVEEIDKLQGAGSYNHDMGVEEKAKSDGAGLNSSHLRRSPCKQMHIRGRERDDGLTTQGLMLKSSLKNEQVNVSSEKSSSCLDLSLEAFPFLPGIKKNKPSKTPQPGPPTVVSPHAQKSSPVLESIEFGYFGPSLSPLILSSPIASKPYFGSSPFKGSEPSESSGHRVLLQPYKLEDDEDFPPLSS